MKITSLSDKSVEELKEMAEYAPKVIAWAAKFELKKRLGNGRT